MARAKVLIVDDEEYFRKSFSKMLSLEDYEVVEADNGHNALGKMAATFFDIVFCDLKLPDLSGMELLKEALQISPESVFIILTAYGTIDSAVEAIRAGAYDYITKPLKKEEILLALERALERNGLIRENRLLKQEVERKYDFSNIIGNSKAIQDLFKKIKMVADTKSTVLITGENGTGKELFAKAIHYHSPRASKPMVVVSCGTIPQALLESELFGHMKGSFTGAVGIKKGLFEVAHEGTLFLDEIGEMPLDLQVKLLRAIEEREIRRIGETQSLKVDVRIISATNKDLKKEVEEGAFRKDLFYRLNVVHIHIPPLRERREDIPLLIKHFIDKYSQENHRPVKGITLEAVNLLMCQPWEGNVRELEHVIEQAVILSGHKNCLEKEDLSLSLHKDDGFLSEAVSSRLAIEEYTKAIIRRYQKEYNETQLAKLLGISTKALWEKRKRWNLSRTS